MTALRISGGRSRGLDVVKLDIDKMTWIHVDKNPAKQMVNVKIVSLKDDSSIKSVKCVS